MYCRFDLMLNVTWEMYPVCFMLIGIKTYVLNSFYSEFVLSNIGEQDQEPQDTTLPRDNFDQRRIAQSPPSRELVTQPRVVNNF